MIYTRMIRYVPLQTRDNSVRSSSRAPLTTASPIARTGEIPENAPPIAYNACGENLLSFEIA